MEAYIKDATYELLNQRIRKVNSHLLGNPLPTNEDEAFLIDTQLDEMEMDHTRLFHLISKLSREYIRSHLYREPVNRDLKVLEEHFGIKVEGREPHLKNWDDLKKLRNSIVHSKSSSLEPRDFLQVSKAWPDDEPVVELEYVAEALTQVFEFAQAIERGIIGTFKHPEKSSSGTSLGKMTPA